MHSNKRQLLLFVNNYYLLEAIFNFVEICSGELRNIKIGGGRLIKNVVIYLENYITLSILLISYSPSPLLACPGSSSIFCVKTNKRIYMVHIYLQKYNHCWSR